MNFADIRARGREIRRRCSELEAARVGRPWAPARELAAAGHKPAVVARILQISRPPLLAAPIATRFFLPSAWRFGRSPHPENRGLLGSIPQPHRGVPPLFPEI